MQCFKKLCSGAMMFLAPKPWIDILRVWNKTLEIGWGCRVHPHWMLLCSSLNGMMQCSVSSSAILPQKMQARWKGAIQGLTAKTKVLKMGNRAGAVQVVHLLVQKTSRSPSFLVNVSFYRNLDIKLQISGRKPACSNCLGCLAQPKQNKKPLQFSLREIEEQKEVY